MLQKDQRFRITLPVPAIAATHWSAPFTGGYEVRIPEGTVLIVIHDQVPGADGVACLPENYDELHEEFIPAEDREATNYGGYSLSVLVTQLLEHGIAC
jgi:hypothetical protein